MTKQIILASSSPYRQELLRRLGVKFSAQAPDVDEDAYKKKIPDPHLLAQTLAKVKAQALQIQFPKAIVIGGDQLLSFEGEILGKAHTVKNAFTQLQRLSGKTHELITSMCVLHPDGEELSTITTKMSMRQLSDDAIKNYLISDNPIDCAGSYKLELKGIALFEKIDTPDHTAIIGLPLITLGNILTGLGVDLLSDH